MFIMNLILAVNIFVSLTAEVGTGSINMFVRDQNTGYGIKADVEVIQEGKRISLLNSDDGGHLVFKGLPGKYEFEIRANEYKTLRTYFFLEQGKEINVEIHLDPIVIESRHEKSELKGYAIYQGYIVNKKTGEPMEGVEIKVMNSGVKTKSDKKGFFSLKLLAPNVQITPDKPPQKETLIFEKVGYKTLLKEVFLISDEHFLKITLEPGQGKIIQQKSHGLYELKSDFNNREIEEKKSEKSILLKDSLPFAISAAFIDPPPSIRVGTNCSCTSCSGVVVMSLESYVQSGLDEEWIASWNAHSLRAGAMAYRSYGAWYVLHPLSPNYDICDNTCCQVWQSDIIGSTQQAAIYTSGIMLEKAGGIARSEYSAENNNKGCGDCFSGTGSSWPCISDDVCCGATPNGHGRGMCQWGSQRWAINRSQNWRWIGEHYYNPGNMYISSPLRITNSWADPDTVNPGQTFTIFANCFNGAENSHPRIMVGASLRRGGNYINDPANDKKVTIVVGNSQVTRLFTVPVGTQEGIYDLLTALWFDIDENNQITGVDLPLYLFILNGGVVIKNPTGVEEISKNRIPGEYFLNPYPNPLTSSVQIIEYSVPNKSNVQIKLFDITGREIATLIDRVHEAGYYRIPFNTSGLSNSVYFYRMNADKFTSLKKIVVLR